MLSLVTKTKLLGLIVDRKLTWVANVLETKKNLPKNQICSNVLVFLPRVILQAVKYGLVLSGSSGNSDIFK